jgi:Flp pilus assembly protein TadG
MGILFFYLELLVWAMLIAFQVDVTHAIKVKSMIQGAADAATLAGSLQNHQEVNQYDEAGAPIGFGFKLNDDFSPENAAEAAWQKNISNFTEGAGFNTVPQFQRTLDDKGITCTVNQTVSMTVSQTVMNRFFGEGAAPQVQVRVPVTAVSKVYP